ncbi:hypothetical protein M1M07_15115 [Rhodococcus sp. HM1]|uniref:hypothetical protein n=1 Tax=unclassified Rhodococcus (in: high G+C Gram-positive bacteria) TaxID=192944 RepID=UPI0018CFECDB|nr:MULTISPECIES: hypothetical protein [unclassified Rhodococcus (in: high G+C Gram-positive bacteria)]MBH0119163.1 hypothetical protein [Rhodococcus sp. CX]MCK8672431.1 hypothetical protein [Rhodococcus sp. HM1]
MRSKTAVIVAAVTILVIGAAALAVNTRILNASSTSDIGRADQVLVPGTAPAGNGTSTQHTSTPPATAPDEDNEEPYDDEEPYEEPDREHPFPHRSKHEPDD